MNPPMNMKALRCLGQSFSGTPQVVLNDGGRATCLYRRLALGSWCTGHRPVEFQVRFPEAEEAEASRT